MLELLIATVLTIVHPVIQLPPVDADAVRTEELPRSASAVGFVETSRAVPDSVASLANREAFVGVSTADRSGATPGAVELVFSEGAVEVPVAAVFSRLVTTPFGRARDLIAGTAFAAAFVGAIRAVRVGVADLLSVEAAAAVAALEVSVGAYVRAPRGVLQDQGCCAGADECDANFWFAMRGEQFGPPGFPADVGVAFGGAYFESRVVASVNEEPVQS